MKKRSSNNLKKLELTKLIIARLTTNSVEKIVGGETVDTCARYSVDKGCDSLRPVTKFGCTV